MIGIRDPTILDEINGVFICLAVTVLHHCLSAFSMTGVYSLPKVFNLEYGKGTKKAARRLFVYKTDDKQIFTLGNVPLGIKWMKDWKRR